MISDIKGLLTLVITCLLSFSCTANNNTWVAQCEKTIERFTAQKANNLTYTSLPDFTKDSSFLSLSWSGLTIPIPDMLYKDVLINYESNNDIAIILVAKNDTRIVIGRVYDNSKIESLFEVVGEPPSAEDIEWTKNAFGKPIRTTDLTDLAYQITLDDIDCNAENQAKESVKLASLVLKNVSPEITAVHKLDLQQQNWVSVGKYGNEYKMHTANIVDDLRNNDEIKQISYIIPNAIGDFSLYAGITKKEIETKNPAWLKALNTALKTKNENDWVAYFEKAKNIGISEKSLAASKSALQIK